MLYFFKRKPQIKIQLINNNTEVKVDMIEVSVSNALVMLYSTVRQIALYLKVDQRYILNQLIQLDKNMQKQTKQRAKELKRQEYHQNKK